jgi:hypothetical protein
MQPGASLRQAGSSERAQLAIRLFGGILLLLALAIMLASCSKPNGTWSTTSDEGAPSARSGHTSVWTGTEMIVWGGSGSSGMTNTGARLEPSSGRWRYVSLKNAPTPREFHTASWMGKEMLVWGGEGDGGVLGDGRIYDPREDTWRPMSDDGAPDCASERWRLRSHNE